MHIDVELMRATHEVAGPVDCDLMADVVIPRVCRLSSKDGADAVSTRRSSPLVAFVAIWTE